MAIAQRTYRESHQDIVHCFGAQQSKMIHLGFRSPLTKSTLSYENNTRDWRIYTDLAAALTKTVKELSRDEPFFR